jgi:hypothetical protein
MTFQGTVVNGMIVLDGAPELPEGFRVNVEFLMDGDDIGAPPEPFDYQEHLAALRASYEDGKAGRTRPFEVAMAELRAKLQLPSLESDE